MLLIPREILERVRRHAAAEYPRECCGIFVGRAGSSEMEVVDALAAKNLADPWRLHDRYVIDPLAILRADRQATLDKLEIVGFYHSHPDHPARPSATDVGSAWPDYVYVIVTVTAGGAGEPRAWRMTGQGGAMSEIPVHIGPTASP